MILSTAIWLALGSNQHGAWGSPSATLDRAMERIHSSALQISVSSKRFKTAAIGPKQPDYLNLVIQVDCKLSPCQLLRELKQIERGAGRRARGKWTARPLDIDIISFKGVRLNWPHRSAGRLTLPHPEAHRRLFVLHPLLSISPGWHHSGLRTPGRQLMARLPVSQWRGVRKA